MENQPEDRRQPQEKIKTQQSFFISKNSESFFLVKKPELFFIFKKPESFFVKTAKVFFVGKNQESASATPLSLSKSLKTRLSANKKNIKK